MIEFDPMRDAYFVKDLGNGLSGSAAVIGTNAKNGAYAFNGNQLGKSSLVVGVKYTF